MTGDSPLLDRAAIQDAFRRLGKHLGLSSVGEVLEICTAVFPDEPVPDRARLILEDFFGAG